MPDPAKLKVLTDARYEIRETCFSCIHLVLPMGWVGHPWGSCGLHKSDHTKHTDGGRLSVRLDGWCPKYEAKAEHGCDIARSGFAPFIRVPPTSG